MSHKHVETNVEIPAGVTVSITDGVITVSGKRGSVKKTYDTHHCTVHVKEGKVHIAGDKMYAHTTRAHVKNMIHGVKEGYTAKMRVLHAHFPMEIKQEGAFLVVKNFLGEKVPRRAPLVNTTVQVKGTDVILESVSKEDLGQTIANIKAALRIRRKDPRVFQDGLYVVRD